MSTIIFFSLTKGDIVCRPLFRITEHLLNKNVMILHYITLNENCIRKHWPI